MLISHSVFLCVLCVFVVNRIGLLLHFWRFAPVQPPKPQWQFCGGGILPHNRRICAISADSAEPAATQKCRFSGLLPYIRQSFRRKICTMCELCENCESKMRVYSPSSLSSLHSLWLDLYLYSF